MPKRMPKTSPLRYDQVAQFQTHINGVYVAEDRSALEGAVNNLLRTIQQSHI